MGGLEHAVIVVGLVHELIDCLLDDELLLWCNTLEDRSIIAHKVAQVGNDMSGDVASLDRSLVHILVECCRCGAIERAPDDIDHGAIGLAGVGVGRVGCSEVVGESAYGAEVGIGLLVAFGHGGELLGEEQEGERLAILADEHVGTLDELGTGDVLQAPNIGNGLFGQVLVLRRCLLRSL